MIPCSGYGELVYLKLFTIFQPRNELSALFLFLKNIRYNKLAHINILIKLRECV